MSRPPTTGQTPDAVRDRTLRFGLEARWGASGLAGLTVQRLAHQAAGPTRSLGAGVHNFTAATQPPDRAGQDASWRSGARKECVVSLKGERSRSGAERKYRAFVLAVALVVSLAACSNDDDDATTTTTVAPSTTTTVTTGDAAQAEIVDRYKRFWEARFEANQPPPNPDFAGLREYATGAQLDNVIEETTNNLRERVALRKPENSVARSSVKVISVDGEVAKVQECVVDDGIVYRYESANKEVVNDAVATHNVEATMRRVDGKWKVELTKIVQRWEGVAGCASSPDF
jgi:hypothetical protein